MLNKLLHTHSISLPYCLFQGLVEVPVLLMVCAAERAVSEEQTHTSSLSQFIQEIIFQDINTLIYTSEELPFRQCGQPDNWVKMCRQNPASLMSES